MSAISGRTPGSTGHNGRPLAKGYVYGASKPARELSPCGTPAAARRHYRRGEPLDEACRQAERREAAGRASHDASAQSPDPREIRNGIPALIPYRYRGAQRWREGSIAAGIRVYRASKDEVTDARIRNMLATDRGTRAAMPVPAVYPARGGAR